MNRGHGSTHRPGRTCPGRRCSLPREADRAQPGRPSGCAARRRTSARQPAACTILHRPATGTLGCDPILWLWALQLMAQLQLAHVDSSNHLYRETLCYETPTCSREDMLRLHVPASAANGDHSCGRRVEKCSSWSASRAPMLRVSWWMAAARSSFCRLAVAARLGPAAGADLHTGNGTL